MAEKIAMKYGKKYLGKKLGKTSAVENGGGDPYKYVSAKTGHKHKKDQKYFEVELHIPREDAIVLAKLMKRAKLLDGFQVGPMRLGVSTLVGLIPAAGDAIDGVLAMSIVKSAGNVSGGLDSKIRARMVSNVVIEIMIGLIPVLGDFADGFWQANTKNVLLLEALLAQRALDSLEKKKLEAEGSGHSPERNGAYTDQRHDHDTHPFRQNAATESNRPHVYTDGTYEDNARSSAAPGYDERHAGVHQRMQAKESERKRQTAGAGNGSGWLKKLQGRNQAQVAKPTTVPRSDAPVQPPRPAQSRHHQVGSF